MALVLVTGATGFIGRRLSAELVAAGHEVRAMTRRPAAYDGPGTAVAGDVLDAGTLGEALAGVEVAYYLVHSLSSSRFEAEDAAGANAFGEAAAEAGVRQIVYLGGLGADGDSLSPHLRSRREVETLLGAAGVPVTTLRAAIVVGHGGISWEMTRQLVDVSPVMVAPTWAATLTQPIALADAVAYLVGVLDHPDALGRTFEVGGADVLSYGQMLQRAAAVQSGRDVPIVSVPVPQRGLVGGAVTLASSVGLAALTDVDLATGRHLLGSMSTEVVVTDDAIRAVVDLEPMGYEDMVRLALGDRLRAGETL
ncbi:NAD(P)H-binding protein [Nocardioides sp. KIGAM211]|uniref:NAD(P)H-binding protein n=1 Tax=Nocardioides luti TaxID=2761101 RepID=A0A7X0RHH4_9ACTN|nr:NAD(P)H-binding protein [Nocardioides luti]MBB6628428.1 NAD(P)H-binding protein [Nocardioides luti]